MSEYTVKEFAAKERVEERTVRRWIQKGALDVRRTPGGGVRIRADAPGSLVVITTKRDNSGRPST